jgi:hypothetical protein
MPIKKSEKRKIKGLHIKKKIQEMWASLTYEEKKDLVKHYEKEIKEWNL